jgi:heme-degrading monooxygenase HmoA
MEKWHSLSPRVKDLKGVIDLTMSRSMKDTTLFAVYAVFEDMRSLHEVTRCAYRSIIG